jgi:hypothetical protein
MESTAIDYASGGLPQNSYHPSVDSHDLKKALILPKFYSECAFVNTLLAALETAPISIPPIVVAPTT